MEGHVEELKILVLGDKGVGKSTAILSFLRGRFFDEPQSTGMYHTVKKAVSVRLSKYVLSIVDIEDWKSIEPEDWAGVAGVLIMYRVESQKSFLHVRSILRVVAMHLGTLKFPVVLVGNSFFVPRRLVSEDMLRELSDRMRGRIPIFDLDMRSCPTHIEAAVVRLVEVILDSRGSASADNISDNGGASNVLSLSPVLVPGPGRVVLAGVSDTEKFEGFHDADSAQDEGIIFSARTRENKVAKFGATAGDDGTSVRSEQPRKIKAATLEKLVERLTYHKYPENTFIQAFLLTFRSFCTPSLLLSLLIKRYCVEAPPNASQRVVEEFKHQKQIPIKLRVFNVLKMWIDNFYEDFGRDPILATALMSFVENVMMNQNSHMAQQLVRFMKKKEAEYEDGGDAMTLAEKLGTWYSQEPPKLLGTKGLQIGKFDILDVNSLELARQMSVFEFDLFHRICPVEFVAIHARMAVDKEDKAPRLLRLMDHYSQTSMWVATEICKQPKLQTRAAVLKQFLAVAHNCMDLGNVNGAMEIVSGLMNVSVHRLKATWGLLSSGKIKGFKILCDYLNRRDNYRLLREKIGTLQPPAIPYIGLFLHDLFVIDSNHSDNVEGGLINFKKRVLIGEVVRELQQFQHQPFNLRPVLVLQNFFARLVAFDEQNLFTLSLAAEPSERRQEMRIPRVSSNMNLPFPSSSPMLSQSFSVHSGSVKRPAPPGESGAPMGTAAGDAAALAVALQEKKHTIIQEQMRKTEKHTKEGWDLSPAQKLVRRVEAKAQAASASEWMEFWGGWSNMFDESFGPQREESGSKMALRTTAGGLEELENAVAAEQKARARQRRMTNEELFANRGGEEAFRRSSMKVSALLGLPPPVVEQLRKFDDDDEEEEAEETFVGQKSRESGLDEMVDGAKTVSMPKMEVISEEEDASNRSPAFRSVQRRLAQATPVTETLEQEVPPPPPCLPDGKPDQEGSPIIQRRRTSKPLIVSPLRFSRTSFAGNVAFFRNAQGIDVSFEQLFFRSRAVPILLERLVHVDVKLRERLLISETSQNSEEVPEDSAFADAVLPVLDTCLLGTGKFHEKILSMLKMIGKEATMSIRDASTTPGDEIVLTEQALRTVVGSIQAFVIQPLPKEDRAVLASLDKEIVFQTLLLRELEEQEGVHSVVLCALKTKSSMKLVHLVLEKFRKTYRSRGDVPRLRRMRMTEQDLHSVYLPDAFVVSDDLSAVPKGASRVHERLLRMSCPHSVNTILNHLKKPLESHSFASREKRRESEAVMLAMIDEEEVTEGGVEELTETGAVKSESKRDSKREAKKEKKEKKREVKIQRKQEKKLGKSPMRLPHPGGVPPPTLIAEDSDTSDVAHGAVLSASALPREARVIRSSVSVTTGDNGRGLSTEQVGPIAIVDKSPAVARAIAKQRELLGLFFVTLANAVLLQAKADALAADKELERLRSDFLSVVSLHVRQLSAFLLLLRRRMLKMNEQLMAIKAAKEERLLKEKQAMERMRQRQQQAKDGRGATLAEREKEESVKEEKQEPIQGVPRRVRDSIEDMKPFLPRSMSMESDVEGCTMEMDRRPSAPPSRSGSQVSLSMSQRASAKDPLTEEIHERLGGSSESEPSDSEETKPSRQRQQPGTIGKKATKAFVSSLIPSSSRETGFEFQNLRLSPEGNKLMPGVLKIPIPVAIPKEQLYDLLRQDLLYFAQVASAVEQLEGLLEEYMKETQLRMHERHIVFHGVGALRDMYQAAEEEFPVLRMSLEEIHAHLFDDDDEVELTRQGDPEWFSRDVAVPIFDVYRSARCGAIMVPKAVGGDANLSLSSTGVDVASAGSKRHGKASAFGRHLTASGFHQKSVSLHQRIILPPFAIPHAGELLKLGGRSSNWNPRWIALTGGVLRYYVSREEAEELQGQGKRGRGELEISSNAIIVVGGDRSSTDGDVSTRPVSVQAQNHVAAAGGSFNARELAALVSSCEHALSVLHGVHKQRPFAFAVLTVSSSMILAARKQEDREEWIFAIEMAREAARYAEHSVSSKEQLTLLQCVLSGDPIRVGRFMKREERRGFIEVTEEEIGSGILDFMDETDRMSASDSENDSEQENAPKAGLSRAGMFMRRMPRHRLLRQRLHDAVSALLSLSSANALASGVQAYSGSHAGAGGSRLESQIGMGLRLPLLHSLCLVGDVRLLRQVLAHSVCAWLGPLQGRSNVGRDLPLVQRVREIGGSYVDEQTEDEKIMNHLFRSIQDDDTEMDEPIMTSDIVTVAANAASGGDESLQAVDSTEMDSPGPVAQAGAATTEDNSKNPWEPLLRKVRKDPGDLRRGPSRRFVFGRRYYDLNERDALGMTCLHHALLRNRNDIFHAMFGMDDVNEGVFLRREKARRAAGKTATSDADALPDSEDVERYRRVDLDIPDAHGQTAAHLACARGNSVALSLFLERGANVNVLTDRHVSVVHIVCALNRADMLRQILLCGQTGIDLSACTSVDKLTALHFCAINNSFMCARMLLEWKSAYDSIMVILAHDADLSFTAVKGGVGGVGFEKAGKGAKKSTKVSQKAAAHAAALAHGHVHVQQGELPAIVEHTGVPAALPWVSYVLGTGTRPAHLVRQASLGGGLEKEQKAQGGTSATPLAKNAGEPSKKKKEKETEAASSPAVVRGKVQPRSDKVKKGVAVGREMDARSFWDIDDESQQQDNLLSAQDVSASMRLRRRSLPGLLASGIPKQLQEAIRQVDDSSLSPRDHHRQTPTDGGDDDETATTTTATESRDDDDDDDEQVRVAAAVAMRDAVTGLLRPHNFHHRRGGSEDSVLSAARHGSISVEEERVVVARTSMISATPRVASFAGLEKKGKVERPRKVEKENENEETGSGVSAARGMSFADFLTTVANEDVAKLGSEEKAAEDDGEVKSFSDFLAEMASKDMEELQFSKEKERARLKREEEEKRLATERRANEVVIHPPDVKKRDSHGRTALHFAAARGYVEMCALLLRHGAVCYSYDISGNSPLFLAVRRKNEELIRLFISHIASQRRVGMDRFICPQTGITVLHVAAQFNSEPRIFDYLVKRTKGMVRVDEPTLKGETPLHYAVKHRWFDLTKYLITQHGAGALILDDRGWSALHYAIDVHSVEITNYLISSIMRTEGDKSSAQPIESSATTGEGQTLDGGVPNSVSIAQGLGEPTFAEFGVNSGDIDGTTAMHLAAFAGNEDLIRLLLRRGARATVLNKWNETPFSYAARNGHLACVRALVDYGAEPTADHHGDTPLHLGARFGHLDCVKLILDKFPKVLDVVNDHGCTALHTAAEAGETDIVSVLFFQGSSVRALDKTGQSVLHKAALSGSSSCVQVVVDSIPFRSEEFINLRDEDGSSALQLAAARYHYDCADILLRKMCDVNQMARLGELLPDKSKRVEKLETQEEGDKDPFALSSDVTLSSAEEERKISLAGFLSSETASASTLLSEDAERSIAQLSHEACVDETESRSRGRPRRYSQLLAGRH